MFMGDENVPSSFDEKGCHFYVFDNKPFLYTNYWKGCRMRTLRKDCYDVLSKVFLPKF